MYSGDSVIADVNGLTTNRVFLQKGLKQGCNLSPLLFNLYVANIAHELENSIDGFPLTTIRISILLFADDIVLISESEVGEFGIDLLNRVEIFCQQIKKTFIKIFPLF